jgi:hypothetical protein
VSTPAVIGRTLAAAAGAVNPEDETASAEALLSQWRANGESTPRCASVPQ